MHSVRWWLYVKKKKEKFKPRSRRALRGVEVGARIDCQTGHKRFVISLRRLHVRLSRFFYLHPPPGSSQLATCHEYGTYGHQTSRRRWRTSETSSSSTPTSQWSDHLSHCPPSRAAHAYCYAPVLHLGHGIPWSRRASNRSIQNVVGLPLPDHAV